MQKSLPGFCCYTFQGGPGFSGHCKRLGIFGEIFQGNAIPFQEIRPSQRPYEGLS